MDTSNNVYPSSSSDSSINTQNLPLAVVAGSLEAYSPTPVVPSLHFPRPNGSLVLASWISKATIDTMPSDDCISLSDSAYEVIYTDGESQDGHCTESVCSVEAPHADDVRSLIGTDLAHDDDDRPYKRGVNVSAADEVRGEKYHDENGAEDALEDYHLSASGRYSSSSSRRSQSIEYATEALRTPSPSQSIQSVHSLGHSIEFDERGVVLRGCVSVWRTIRHFTDDETACLRRVMAIKPGRGRLVAKIRLSMSTEYLFTNRPLRILYVGSDAAHHDIIYKISSALTASKTQDDPASSLSSQSSDRIYNIVPISAFGSAKIPEVELMETSAFQIKVETCTSAVELPTKYDEGGRAYRAGHTLTLNKERKISLPLSRSGPGEPVWELPHLAVFYCADTDDESARATRNSAWSAMVSRSIPCLFITHNLDYEKPPVGRWRGYQDPRVLHISVEAEGPSEQVVPERLPIDLSSFLAIDARQMNRNLACITGLSEAVAQKQCQKGENPASYWKLSSAISSSDFLAILPNWALSCRLVLTALLLMAGYIFGSYLLVESQDTTPVDSVVKTALPVLADISTTTATVTIEHTSTRTVEVSRPESSNVPWFFDTMLWPTPGHPVFTASKGTNAILLKIYADYSHRVTPGRLQVSVHRDFQPVDAQVTVHDGQAVLVEVARKDAHGVLTVRVETTQKPKIHESYDIDFGHPLGMLEAPLDYIHDMAMHLAASVDESASGVQQRCSLSMQVFSEAAFDQVAWTMSSLLYHLNATTGLALEAGREVRTGILVALDDVMGRTWTAEEAQMAAEISLRQAQVSSKLWWLKIRGQMQAYDAYERKAVEYIAGKLSNLEKLRSGKKEQQAGLPLKTGLFSYLGRQ